MHKEGAVSALCNQLFNVALQNAELHQPAHHDAHHFAGHFLNGGAGAEQFKRAFQRGEHNVVNLALCRGEFAADREGAGDIAGIAFVFAARVNQHQIARAHFAFVLGVVQDAAVFARAHNGVVGGKARAVAVELMLNFAFQLILKHARAAHLHRAGVGQRGNFARAAQHFNLFSGFKQAHLMHDGPPVGQRGGRFQILARAFAQLVERSKEDGIRVSVFALRVVDRIKAIEQLIEMLVNLRERQRAIDAELLRRGLLAETATKPDFSGFVAHAVEEHAVVVGVIAFDQHQHRFRLVKTGEIPEIAVLAIGVFTVCAAGRFRRGKDQRRATRNHLRQ